MALFAFDIILLCVFAVAMFTALLGYLRSKEKMHLYEAALCLCFLVDIFIIFAAQFLMNDYPATAEVVASEGISVISMPAVKITFFVLRQVCYLLLARELFGLEYPKWAYAIFPLLFVVYVYTYIHASADGGSISLLFFYSIMQVYLLALCVLCLWKVRGGGRPDLHRLLAISFVLLLGVVGIDLLWFLGISNPFSIVFETQNEGNVLESLLHVFYSVLIIHSVLKSFATHDSEQTPHLETDDERIRKLATALQLTKREAEVFLLLLEDYSYQEICEKLVVSMGTVKSHAHSIYNKAGCSRRGDLRRLLS